MPARRSMPRRKSKATNITAAAMMKLLKPRNSRLNGVVPTAAASPCCLSGWKVKPIAAGSNANLSRRPSAVTSAVGRTRIEVVCPKRLPQSCRPWASETNALGVAPNSFQ